ncbi:MAG: tetratricopeptide repeat protein [Spirochaetales bacterium]|nr:tetratricopeptide repeat protein [Spirochaetales bacterium]
MKLLLKKNRKNLILVLFSLAGGILSPLFAQMPVDDLFSQGRDAFSEKSYSRAETLFREFLDNYPDDPRADGVNYMLSVSYFYMKNYIEAINAFNLFESSYADSAYGSRVSYWLGLCYYALKDYEKAAEYFLTQTAFRSESFFVSRSYLYLGESYEKASMPELAMEAYRNSIISGGEEKIISQTRLKLGILFFNKGDFSSAREQFAEILNNSIDTDLVSDSQFYIGESLYYMGELKDAASKLQFYLFMNSNNKFREAAVFRLGDIYQSLGMNDEAVKYLELLLSDYRNGRYYLDGLRVLGKTWKSAGNMDKAAGVYREIITLSDDDYEIQNYYFELAMLRIDDSEIEDAESFLKEVLKGPDDEKVRMSLYYLGQILMDSGRKDEAVSYLYRLVEQYPDSKAADDASMTITQYLQGKGDVLKLAMFLGSQINRDTAYLDYFLYVKGSLDEAQGNGSEALAAYDRIIDEFPDSGYLASALHRKGKILIGQNEGDDALSVLDMALREADSEDQRTDILVDKALLLYDMGRLEQADYAFTILLEKDIDFPRKDEILFRQGELALEARKYSEAAEFFRRSAEESVGDGSIEALFKMGRSYFYMLNFKTSERIFSDLSEKLSSTSDRKREAMKMTALSIFLQKDWTRTLQFSDLMVTSLGVYPNEIRLIKLISLLALNRTDAFSKELLALGTRNTGDVLISTAMTQIAKVDINSTVLIFRSLLGAYPDESASFLVTLLITDLMYITSDSQWIEDTYGAMAPLISDNVLSIGLKQSYDMNKN